MIAGDMHNSAQSQRAGSERRLQPPMPQAVSPRFVPACQRFGARHIDHSSAAPNTSENTSPMRNSQPM